MVGYLTVKNKRSGINILRIKSKRKQELSNSNIEKKSNTPRFGDKQASLMKVIKPNYIKMNLMKKKRRLRNYTEFQKAVH